MKRENLKNDREKLYTEYCQIIKPTATTDQPTRPTPQPTTTPNSLLGNPEFEKLIGNAQKAGLIDKIDSHKWLGQTNQLALFAKLASDRLKLNNAQKSDGDNKVSWQPFELWFGIEKNTLLNNYNAIEQTGMKSQKRKQIELMFD